MVKRNVDFCRDVEAVKDVQGVGAVAIRVRYGFHISEQTNSIFADSSAPSMVKNRSKLLMVIAVLYSLRSMNLRSGHILNNKKGRWNGLLSEL